MQQACCKLSILLACCNLLTSCNKQISSSYKLVKIRLVATCHQQTCYNLLKQLASSMWITSFDKSVRTTCNKLVGPTMLLQVVNKLVATCAFLAAYCVTCFACLSPGSFYLATFYLIGKWVNAQYGTQPHDTNLSLVHYKLYSYTM